MNISQKHTCKCMYADLKKREDFYKDIDALFKYFIIGFYIFFSKGFHYNILARRSFYLSHDKVLISIFNYLSFKTVAISSSFILIRLIKRSITNESIVETDKILIITDNLVCECACFTECALQL